MEPDKEPVDPGDLTDSERARLRLWAADQEFEDKLAARRKRRIEAIKGWASWFTTLAVALGMAWQGIAAAWGALMETLGRLPK